MRVVKAGAVYFALVFATGFVLGTIRQLWVVPRFGVMVSELLETPLMLVACILSARWTLRRLAVPPALWQRLGMGLVALALLVGAELILALQLRGLSLAEYIANREPVSGIVFLVMLGVFAALPSLIARR